MDCWEKDALCVVGDMKAEAGFGHVEMTASAAVGMATVNFISWELVLQKYENVFQWKVELTYVHDFSLCKQ